MVVLFRHWGCVMGLPSLFRGINLCWILMCCILGGGGVQWFLEPNGWVHWVESFEISSYWPWGFVTWVKRCSCKVYICHHKLFQRLTSFFTDSTKKGLVLQITAVNTTSLDQPLLPTTLSSLLDQFSKVFDIPSRLPLSEGMSIRLYSRKE